MRIWLLATASAVIATAGASAQDITGAPLYGSVELEGGFADDPYEVSLTAGGGNDASELGGGCVGLVGDPPDFDLYYSPGSLPLYLSASSDSDVSLVVNLPDGSWACDDDGAEGLNPGLYFDDPQEGLYDIWVGRVGGTDMAPATLHISELGFGGDFTGGTGVDVNGEPYFGSTTLVSGFTPDPHSVYISAGGANPASELDSSCVGSIGGRPDYNLNYTAGSFPLYFSATSDSDLTIVVRAPDGAIWCDDDGADNPLDPGLTFSKPQSGLYSIWVGDYGGDETPSSTLHISETGYHDTRVDDGGLGGAIDFTLPATYGEATLVAGFTPDPHTTSMTPGGSVDAQTVGESCRGQVASAPDLRLHYTSGAFPLYVFAESDDDTTLVINTPSGEWMCDDDSSAGLNPGLGFKSPQSGQYDIWVGRYSGGASGNAVLNISETTFPTD